MTVKYGKMEEQELFLWKCRFLKGQPGEEESWLFRVPISVDILRLKNLITQATQGK